MLVLDGDSFVLPVTSVCPPEVAWLGNMCGLSASKRGCESTELPRKQRGLSDFSFENIIATFDGTFFVKRLEKNSKTSDKSASD